MTKELLIRRFWVLYFAVLGTGAEKLLDELDILASQIDANNPQCIEALDYFEANFVKIMLESHETPPYFLMN